MNQKRIEWILKIAVAGEFIGHGMLAISGKAQWVAWIVQLIKVTPATATTLLLIVGILDVVLAVILLIKPLRPLVLYMAFWGFFTALLRPIVGESIWDFIERTANWGAPLALYFLLRRE